MTKNEFFDFYYRQLSEPIYLTDKVTELKQEIQHNCWHIGIPENLVNEISVDDISVLVGLVKDHYKKHLDSSDLDIDLWFYLWMDELAGQLRFNFINSNHYKLPFSCDLNRVDDAGQIIRAYFEYYNETANDTEPEEFILDVYSEMIFKRND